MSTATNPSTDKRRKVCPVSRGQFHTHAKPLAVTVAGQTLPANPKAFNTGSVGFYANGKVDILIDGVLVSCQVGMTITAIGSKDLPALPPSPEVQAIVNQMKATA